MSDQVTPVEQHIRTWLETFVVGLNLCPFAKPVLFSTALRITVSKAIEFDAMLKVFLTELDLIQQSSEQEIATTLLVFPDALASFDDYLDFVESAEELLTDVGLDGVIQLASFHPLYQFAGEPSKAASHFTNRSPYPVIHFLREAMMTRVLTEFSNPEQIPERNIQTLEKIGRAEIEQRWHTIFSDKLAAHQLKN
jgi:hypothetical protein